MKLKDLIEQYGEYDVEEWFEIGTDGVADEKGIKLKKPKPKTVWDLKMGDKCYYIDLFGDVEDTGGYLSPLSEAVDMGIVFLTKEEAEKDVERRKVETLLLKYGGRRWFTGASDNWYLFSLDNVKACVEYTSEPIQGTIYFDSKNEAIKAVSEIGEERIKKVLFEVR